MSDFEPINTEGIKQKPLLLKVLLSIFKYSIKITFIILIFVIILSSSLIVLTQFQFFRQWLSGFVIDYINENLTAKVEFSDITLNPFRGIELKDIRLIAAGDTVLSAKSIFIDPDLYAILDGKFVINSIYLDNPRIKLLKSLTDSSWNYTHIVKPSTDTAQKSQGEPTRLFLDLKKIHLSHASLIMRDSTVAEACSNKLNVANMEFDNFFIDVSATMRLPDNSFTTTLNIYDLKDNKSGIKINNLLTQLELNTEHVIVHKFYLTTDNSNIALKATAKKLNLFDVLTLEQIKKTEFELHFEADKVSFEEISRITGVEEFSKSDYKISMDINGKPDKIIINKLNVGFNNSLLQLTGKLNNIMEPSLVTYQLYIDNTHIFYNELINSINPLENIGIPDFGKLDINEIYINGKYDTANVNANISCDFGSLLLKSGIGMKDKLSYNISLLSDDINLGLILNNSDMIGKIDCQAEITGNGTSLRDMVNNFRIRITDTPFNKYFIKELNLIGGFLGQGELRVDSLNLKILNSTTDNLDSSRQTSMSKIDLSGNFNLLDFNHLKYDIDLNVNDVNLAELLSFNNAPEHLSSHIQVRGSAIEPDSINAVFNADFNECQFGDRTMMPFSVNVELGRDSSKYRFINVKSNFADVNVIGEFNFSNIFSIVEKQSNYLASFISNKVNNFSFNPIQNDTIKKISVDSFAAAKVNISTIVRDLSPISLFIPNTKILCNVELNTTLVVSPTSADFYIDSLNLDGFEFQNPYTHIKINPSNVQGRLSMNIVDSLLSVTNIELSLQGSENNNINNLIIDNPKIFLTSSEDVTSFQLLGKLNNSISTLCIGNINYLSDSLNLNISKLSVVYDDFLHWDNINDLSVVFSAHGIDIKNFELHRKNGENISILGRLSGYNADNIIVSLDSLPFQSINYFLPASIKSQLKPLQGSIQNITAKLNGDLNFPVITASIETSPLLYNKSSIGKLSGNFKYV